MPCLSLKTRRQICNREEIHNLEEELNKTETTKQNADDFIRDIKKREVPGKEERCSGLPPPPFYKNSCKKCVRAFKTGGARQRAARLSRLNARLIAVSFKITLF